MDMLYSVAFPVLAEQDRTFIEAFRAQHDPQKARIIPAHFTLVFGCSAVPLPQFLEHTETIIAMARKIRFSCRSVVPGAGLEGTAHVFLVPDEGRLQISLLHDHLYSGVLRGQLRRDMPYLPHITIGTFESTEKATLLCDELNRSQLEIRGMIDTISVGALENDCFRQYAHYQLKE